MKNYFNSWARRVLACVVCGVMAVGLSAVPAYRGWQTKTLTDGSQITVRQVGDEFFHYWETEDGKQAFEQADGTFVVTGEAVPTKAQARAKRAASTLQSSKPRKSIGERNLAPRGLLVLVQFSDVTFNSANNNAAFNDMLNKAGYDYNGATGSAVDYFHAQSNNAYNPTFDVVGPVTLSHNLEYYGEQGTINGYKENDMYIADFVIDAVTAAESAGCDFSKYDSNNDGYVDIVYFIYAGKGQANGGSTETIWPHNWELISAIYYEQTHGGSGYYVNVNSQGNITSMNIPTFDGKMINNYACSAELRGDGNRSGIGTFCHEFSHVLGLPDYYDADGEDNGENVQTPQEWSIMDYGSYNNNEMTPPNYSIYDKYFMGWATPKFLAKDEKKDVSLTTGYDDAYQITGGSSLVDFTNTGTVYYLENRQKTGWDAALPGHGMLVWQVKYSATVWSENAPNNTAGNARYTIIPANGRTSNYGYGSDPFPGTSNVKSYTPATGCALTQISESDGVISFKYNGGEVNYWTYGLSGEHCTVPANGSVDKGAALNLTITPDAGYTLADADCWLVEMGDDLLEYGTGFTYNENNGAFAIASVTGNVYIVANAKAVPVTLTWMANGSEFTTTNASGTITLPENEPEIECEGRVFVGWCADANYESETTAPTFVKNGDAVTEATTFYAVFATQGTGGTQFKLVSTLTNGKEYVFVTRNTEGSGYAFSSAITTGTSVSIAESGDDKIVSGTPADAIIWTVTSGYKLTTNDETKTNRELKINGSTFSLATSGSDNLAWTTSYGLNGKSNGTTKYYLQCSSDGTFSKDNTTGSTTNRVWAYEKSNGGSSYSDYTTSCTVPTEVTVTFNANGGTGEMSEQVVSYNTATALNACTFTREGYSFAGWATSATGEVVYTDKANVTLTKNTTLFAKWNINNYTISLAEVSHGTLSTSPAGNANYGATVTVTATPAENYTLGSISVVDANAQAVALSGNTFTMPASNVTVSATFNEKPTYTIRFFNNGAQVGEDQTVHLDGTPVVPANPAKPCDDYTFVGWYTAALAEDNTDEPTCVTNFTVTKDQDYYAVFSMTEEGDELSNDYKKITTLDELTNGNYVVVGNGGYALKNAVYNQYYLGVVSVSVSGTTVSNPTANIIWQITRSGNSISFYNTSVNQYACLYEVSTHHNLRMQDDANWFTPTVSDGNWSFESNDCSGWYMVHFIYNSNHEFAAKQSATTTIQLYKQSPASIIYYTTAPTCVECTAAVTVNKGTAANGSFNIDKVDAQSTCAGKLVVTVSDIVPAHGYLFKEITQTGIEGAVIDQNAKTVTYAKKTNGESTINVVFEEKPKYTIAFFDNGTQIGESQEVYEGEQPEVPANPEPACSAYTFEGWYTAELVPNNTVKPTYVTDFTATQDQNYYAIFKKVETLEVAEHAYPYTFTSQSWADATNSWTSDGSGNQLSTGQGVQVTKNTGTAGAHTKQAVSNVSKVVVNYCTNASSGAGSIMVKVGEIESTEDVTTTGGTTLRDLVFDFDNISGIVTFEVSCTSNSIYVKAVTITAGGSVTTTFYTSSVLAINCNWPTDMEEVETTQPVAVKALMNGQIVIIRGEAVYSITGARIK